MPSGEFAFIFQFLFSSTRIATLVRIVRVIFGSGLFLVHVIRVAGQVGCSSGLEAFENGARLDGLFAVGT